MSSELIVPLALAGAAVTVAAMLCLAGLSAWRGWLAYKKLQLEAVRGQAAPVVEEDQGEPGNTGARIELASVKERLRRLEVIASGVEL